MATTRAPSPRYRTDDPAPVIHLQEDDLSILWHVYCNRVMDAKSIYTLFPHRSEQVLSRRLNRLRKGPNPFLHRLPQASNRLQVRNGSDPQAYAIASQGAHALRLYWGMDVSGQRWTQKNRELRPSTIQHDLATSRFMARLWRDTAAAEDGARLLYQPEFEATGRPGKGRALGGLKNTLRTKIVRWPGQPGEQGTAPDRIFALSAEGRRQYFFLEMDEGTETIEPGQTRLRRPSFWRDTSLLRKFVIYASAFETKAHQATFDIPVFRVLTVTTKPERVQAMVETCRTHLKHLPPGLFLFADWQSINTHSATLLSFPFKDSAKRATMLVNEQK